MTVPVTDQLTDSDLARLAAKLRAYGLGVPVEFVIESHRPLCGILENLLLAVYPVISAITGNAKSQMLFSLVSDPRNLDRLSTYLSQQDGDGTR